MIWGVEDGNGELCGKTYCESCHCVESVRVDLGWYECEDKVRYAVIKSWTISSRPLVLSLGRVLTS